MQTHLADFIRDTPRGDTAEQVLRTCVHCGFCLATCPTYQLLGDERDSPRGRIYLIKQVLEGHKAGEEAQLHLDRCLTCRACETTCPSGVEYGKLADIGREVIEEQTRRPLGQRATRWALRKLLPEKELFADLMALGQTFRPLVPQPLKAKIPPRQPAPDWPTRNDQGELVLMLEGCVQPAMAPAINPVTAQLIQALGYHIERTPEVKCCGAVSHHLGFSEEAKQTVRHNIDAWWPYVEKGARHIVVNASGCGVAVKEYDHLLRDDPDYAHKAARIAELAVDPVELLEAHAERLQPAKGAAERIAFHSPCTLQHGQQLKGRVEALLYRVGFKLTTVPDALLCCGSAGTYSVLQPKLSKQLRSRKLEALQSDHPKQIATANIGCLTHLAETSDTPLCHWLELLEVK